MKKIFLYVFLVLMFCSNAFAETSAAWKTDNKYLTPKCFIYEWMSSDNFEEYYNRYGPENKKWEDWWNNIGLYYGKEIPLEDSFEASWGEDTLSLTRYLKDCTSSKPITEDEEELLSYEVSGTMPEGSCKILAPNVNAKCLDIKIIDVLQSFPAMTSVMNSNIYGIFELANKNKIILPLKMNYVVEKKTETKTKTSAEIAEISSLNFEWLKKRNSSSTHSLIWEDEFEQLAEYNIPSKSLFLGFGKGERTLFNNLRVMFGAPSDVKYDDDKRYIYADGCRPHSCREKGLFWIDTEDKVIIGVLRHFYLHDYDGLLGDGDFLIFSKGYETFDEISDVFFKVLKEWIKEKEISPTKVRFIGADNSIKDVTKEFEKYR